MYLVSLLDTGIFQVANGNGHTSGQPMVVDTNNSGKQDPDQGQKTVSIVEAWSVMLTHCLGKMWLPF